MRDVRPGWVYIIGAGPGDPELLTVRGARILERADVVIYADSLIDQKVLEHCRADARILTSSNRDLGELVGIMTDSAQGGLTVARLQSGDPSLYGAISEQMQALQANGVPFEIIPGVSAVFAAAAVLERELTVPGISQTVILTRVEGRASAVPPASSLQALAQHRATIALFLSAALAGKVTRELVQAGYSSDAPAAIVYRATWEDQQIVWSTVGHLAEDLRLAGIHRQALILVGPFLTAGQASRSKLYDASYSHLFRRSQGLPEP